MAMTRTYLVSFLPATRTSSGGFTISLTLGGDNPTHTVVADSFPKLEAAVRALAHDYGQTCHPHIRLPRGQRNPPGLRAWLNKMNIIDVVEG